MLHFSYSVGLGQVLVRIANVFHRAQVGLEDRPGVFVLGVELELIADIRQAFGDAVSAERQVQLIQNVVIEIVFVGTNAGFLEGIYSKGNHEIFLSAIFTYERVHVGGVSRRIQGDQRGIHVTAAHDGGRQAQQRGHAAGDWYFS